MRWRSVLLLVWYSPLSGSIFHILLGGSHHFLSVFSVGLFEEIWIILAVFFISLGDHVPSINSSDREEIYPEVKPHCMLFQVQRCRYVPATGLPLLPLVIVNPVQGPVPQPGEEDGENQHQHTPRLGGRELCPSGTAAIVSTPHRSCSESSVEQNFFSAVIFPDTNIR